MDTGHQKSDYIDTVRSTEKIVAEVLSKLEPKDIINSTILQNSFTDFLSRGSLEDCWKLFPQIYQKVSSRLSPDPKSIVPFSSSPNFITSRTNLDTAQLPTDVIQKSSTDSALFTPQTSASTFFGALYSNQKRVQHLVRVAQALEKAEALPLDSCRALWSGRAGVFETSKNLARARRLQLGRQKIAERDSAYDCAWRLGLMFLAHDVDYLRLTLNDLKLESGCGRKTVAFEHYAKDSGILEQQVRDDYKKSGNFYQLLIQSGPGSIFNLGPDVTHIWTRKMTKADITHVLNYRAKHTKLEEQAVSMNQPGACVIVKGLLAYGWTLSELFSTRTRLVIRTIPYLDEETLKEHEMHDVIPYLNIGRQDRGFANADRPSKKRKNDVEECKRRTRRRGQEHVSDNQNTRAVNPNPVTADSNALSEDSFSEDGQFANATNSAGNTFDTMSPRSHVLDDLGSDPRLLTVYSSVLTIDPSMMRNLPTSSNLPDDPPTVDPRMLTNDPSMMRYLPTSSNLPDDLDPNTIDWEINNLYTMAGLNVLSCGASLHTRVTV